MLDTAPEPELLDCIAGSRVVLGYAGGWLADGDGVLVYSDVRAVALRSSVGLTLNVFSRLTVSKKLSFSYPDYEFSVNGPGGDIGLSARSTALQNIASLLE